MPALRSLGGRLLDRFWTHAPVAPRERIVWWWAPKFLVSVSGVCVNPRRQALLLEQRFPRGERWSLPAGLVEHGEHPEATLQREVREETGLDATISTLLWVFDAPRQIHLCYLCFVPDREPALQASEIIGCEWIDLTAPDPRRALERQRAADVLAGQGLPPDASRSRATTPMPR